MNLLFAFMVAFASFLNPATPPMSTPMTHQNLLADTQWYIDALCFTPPHHQKIDLKPLVMNSPKYHSYFGYWVEFRNDGTFSTRYNQFCGRDCFKVVQGSYEFVGANEVQLTITSIQYSGGCKNEISQQDIKINGSYLLEKQATSGNYTLVLHS